jgi:uncharacterized protein YndB with AHSA1/START domain
MVRVEITTDIDRPVDEVFAYVTDANKAPDWVSAIVETTHAEPPAVGAKATQIAKFLGRKFEISPVITQYEPNRRFVFGTQSPFHINNDLTFSPRDGGTRIDAVLEGDVGSFFKVAEPLVAKAVRRQFAADYGNLKELLEAGIAATPGHTVKP